MASVSSIGNRQFDSLISVELPEVIDRTEYRKPERFDEGSVWFFEYTMSNGLRYRELTGLPQEQTSEVATDIATPWTTNELGHNFRSLLGVMSLGKPGRLIGPPRARGKGNNPVSRLVNTVELAHEVDLLSDTLAFLAILNAHDEEGSFKRTILPGRSLYYGESRGAMMGFGVNALARQMGRMVLYSEWLDACIAQKTTVLEIANTKNGIKKGILEIVSGAASVARLAREPRGRFYPDTLDLSAESLLPNITTRRTLFSGIAGRFAGQMPGETTGTAVFFENSIANSAQLFTKTLKKYPNVAVKLVPGFGHVGGLMSRDALFASLGRLNAAYDQVDSPHGQGTIYDLSVIKAAPKINKKTA